MIVVENAPTSRLPRSAATGLVQDPLDLVGRNPDDLGDLRDGHAVLHPDAHPGNLRRWDCRAGGWRRGVDRRRSRPFGHRCRFRALLRVRRVRRGTTSQSRERIRAPHARRFRREQRLGRLSGLRDPLTVIRIPAASGGSIRSRAAGWVRCDHSLRNLMKGRDPAAPSTSISTLTSARFRGRGTICSDPTPSCKAVGFPWSRGDAIKGASPHISPAIPMQAVPRRQWYL